jgi:hypothetical protein
MIKDSLLMILINGRKKLLSTIDISKVRNIIFFDYVEYHPFVKTLKQYEYNKNLKYRKSELFKFYNTFNPQNASQSLFEDDSLKSLINISKFIIIHPWHKFIIKGEKNLNLNHGCQYFGNVSKAKCKLEFKRLIKLYNKIKKNGYDNKRCINGYLLKRHGDYRFVVTGGNHRIAVLTALNYKFIKVKIKKIIDIKDINNLDENYLTRNEMIKIFNRFFDENGNNKLERINIMISKTKIYQLGAAKQKFEIIRKYLTQEDQTLLDIGCNFGYLVEKFAEKGINSAGYEAEKKYIDSKNKRIINKILTPNNVRYIKKHDVILLLSVNQQFNQAWGKEIEEKMIKTIGEKCNKFFFQPASIKSKYKEPPKIIDNNKISIISYYQDKLKEIFNDREISYIGETKLTTKKERYRYIFLIEKKGMNSNEL